MDSKEYIENLHSLLDAQRSLHRISYRKMGDVIGYSDVGFKKALDNRNLSLVQIEEIVVAFKLKGKFSELLRTENKVSEPSAVYGKSIEDMIAVRVVEKIKPYLEKIELMEAVIGKMYLEMMDEKEKSTR